MIVPTRLISFRFSVAQIPINATVSDTKSDILWLELIWEGLKTILEETRLISSVIILGKLEKTLILNNF